MYLRHRFGFLYHEYCVGGVYEFTGLDYWTGLLDWITGLITMRGCASKGYVGSRVRLYIYIFQFVTMKNTSS